MINFLLTIFILEVFEVTEISKFKSFVRFGLTCAFAFCASMALCYAEDLIDTVTNKTVGTYDKESREVTINSKLARFNEQGRLSKDVDFSIQRALHSYELQALFYNNGEETTNTHAIVTKSAQPGGKVEIDSNNFNDEYRFVPRQITFGDVIYTFDSTNKEPGNDVTVPVGDLTISTRSTTPQHIYTPIIMAFGSTVSEYVGREDAICSGIEKVIITGNFEEIPSGCFRNMPELKSVDASNSRIKRVCSNAFGGTYRNHSDLNVNTVLLPPGCNKEQGTGIPEADIDDNSGLSCGEFCGVFKKAGCIIV